ncbi:MAG TPA: hypothetical protein VGT41_01540 [Candidatus Babeliales bacterium]|nr:hypothetical protein [Candidatus Babeliales bacterium]
MMHKKMLTIFWFLAGITSFAHLKTTDRSDWENYKLCCEGNIPPEYTEHQAEIIHAIEYEIDIEIIEEIHSFEFPQNYDYPPHTNEHTPAYPSSYVDNNNQSNFSLSIGSLPPNLPQHRPMRDPLSIRAAHFKDPELTNVMYYHRGCASWDQQRYWDAAFKLFGEWRAKNQQLKTPVEYQYVYTMGSHKAYIHNEHRYKIMQQWDLYDHAGFWDFLKSNFDYNDWILNLDNKLKQNPDLREKLSQDARDKIGSQATKIALAQAQVMQTQCREKMQMNFVEQLPDYDDGIVYDQELQEFCDDYDYGISNHFERRQKAYGDMQQNGAVYVTRAYTVSKEARKLVRTHIKPSIPYESRFTSCYGNQLQQVAHQDCLYLLEKTVEAGPGSFIRKNEEALVHTIDAAREYNHVGHTEKSFHIIDFCYSLLDYAQAIAQGTAQRIAGAITECIQHPVQTGLYLLDCSNAIAEGIEQGISGAIVDSITHPVQTGLYLIAGKYVLGYQLCKLACNVIDIAYADFYDPVKGKEKWDAFIKPIDNLINAFTSSEVSTRDKVKTTSQLMTQWRAHSQLTKGLGGLFAKAKTSALNWIRKNPLAPPEGFLATPEGVLLNASHDVGKSKGVAQRVLDKAREKAITPEGKIPGGVSGSGNMGKMITPEMAHALLKESRELRQLQKTIERLKKTINKNIFKTHYAETTGIKQFEAAEAKAAFSYASIREAMNDINRVSKNTGLSQNIIRKIKEHVFFDEHILSNGIKRFAPDLDIAEAWNRLVDNKFVQADLTWLLHEYAESILMKGQQMDWRSAHGIINQFYNWEILIK